MDGLKKVLLIHIIFIFPITLYSLDLNTISLPKGFKIEIFSSGLSKPRGLTVTENNTVYVGSKSGYIYKITNSRELEVIEKNLNSPIGVDYYKGDLYVSEIDKIRVFKDINSQKRPYSSTIVYDRLPKKKWHGWKYIKVGSDDKIYVNIGAPCNTCLPTGNYGTISRMDLDGSNFEVFARGVRNSVGFDWEPTSGDFWFTDNGPDKFGDDIPADELNRVIRDNQHFGFPYIHGKHIKDPNYFKYLNSIDVTLPEWELPAHVAALGMRFYTGNMFPKEYRGGIFIAEHGSWNRSSKIGYRLSFLKIESGKVVGYKVFASGWERDEIVYGRPVDVEILSDGSIILSDDYSGNIYRIYY